MFDGLIMNLTRYGVIEGNFKRAFFCIGEVSNTNFLTVYFVTALEFCRKLKSEHHYFPFTKPTNLCTLHPFSTSGMEKGHLHES